MSTNTRLLELRQSVWLEQGKYELAETKYLECQPRRTAGKCSYTSTAEGVDSGVSRSIEATMSMIQESLSSNPQTGKRLDLEKRVEILEEENKQFKKYLELLKERVMVLENKVGVESREEEIEKDDDFDLFGDDVEEEEREEKPAVTSKSAKSKKPPVVAKSTIVLEVKPWETETDMKEMERLVREISCDGLVWGASRLVPVAFGIKKLQISCVVEDEKVGTDFLEEAIVQFEDYVQSVDVAAFNKI